MADTNVTQITPSAAGKIRTAVQRVLADPRDQRGLPNRAGAPGTYWAELQMTGTRTKGGMYTAYLCAPQTSTINSSSSGSLTETTVMVADTSKTVYFINKREFGSTGHALSTSSTPKTFSGRPWGTDTDGTPIYLVNECQ